jgi:hypothetical protein
MRLPFRKKSSKPPPANPAEAANAKAARKEFVGDLTALVGGTGLAAAAVLLTGGFAIPALLAGGATVVTGAPGTWRSFKAWRKARSEIGMEAAASPAAKVAVGVGLRALIASAEFLAIVLLQRAQIDAEIAAASAIVAGAAAYAAQAAVDLLSPRTNQIVSPAQGEIGPG